MEESTDKEGEVLEEESAALPTVQLQESDALEVNETSGILYRVEDKPPIAVSLLFGLQHYLLALGGLLTFPMLVMKAICVDDSPASDVSSAELLGTFFVVCGISSFVQTTFGVRLPLLQGVAAAYFIPTLALLNTKELKCPDTKVPAENLTMAQISADVYYYYDNDGSIIDSTERWQSRIRVVQGSIAVASILQLILGATGLIGYLMPFIGPLTIAPCLILITYSMVQVAVFLAGGHWGIVMFCLAIIVICSQYLSRLLVPMPSLNIREKKMSWTRKPIFAMFPILIAIALSWLLCYILTVVGAFPNDPNAPGFKARTDTKPNVMQNSPWFRVPYPFQWGMPTVTLGGVIGMMAAVLLGIIESIADYHACARMAQEKAPPPHAINRGILLEGFGVMLAALLGTGNSTTTFSQNIAAIGITRVASRRVIQVAGILFVVIGLFTKVCGVFVLLPTPILGAILISVIGMIGSVGMSTLQFVDMSSSRNLFILGLSTFMGMTIQTWTKNNSNSIDIGVPALDNVVTVVLQTGMLIAGVVGCLLDNTIPASDESRGIKTWIQSDKGRTSTKASTYDLPFKTNFKYSRIIPFCPQYKRETREEAFSPELI